MNYELSEEEINKLEGDDNIWYIYGQEISSSQALYDHINSLLKDRYEKGKEEATKQIKSELMGILPNYNCTSCGNYLKYGYHLK